MMKKDNKNIYQLISKYMSKEIDEHGFYQLQKWLCESEENKTLFIDYLKTQKIENQVKFSKHVNPSEAWERILSQLQTPLTTSQKPNTKVKRLLPLTILKYAALVILLISIGYYFQNSYFQKNNITPANHISLELDNGNIQYITEDGTIEIKDANGHIVGSQNKDQLIYQGNAEEKLTYNTLTIPYGKRFKLQLSDGTIVHLNAGTSLKYPTKFIKGKHREVYLTGEAFFSVAKDTKHPFIVNAQNLDIKVLGTEFNVSAYQEDTITNVVLIEGSVEMSDETNNQNTKKRLIPGDKGTFNRSTSHINTKQVNTSIYTSWMQGELFFRNITFENIVKKLERHYDVKIIVQNKSLNQEIFNASFKNEPIENILTYFSKSFDIHYKIEKNIIYIN